MLSKETTRVMDEFESQLTMKKPIKKDLRPHIESPKYMTWLKCTHISLILCPLDQSISKLVLSLSWPLNTLITTWKTSAIYSKLCKHSSEVCHRRKTIDISRHNVWASTSNAIVVYPNINNDKGINAFEKHFKLYAKEWKNIFLAN